MGKTLWVVCFGVAWAILFGAMFKLDRVIKYACESQVDTSGSHSYVYTSFGCIQR